jgi:putative acetyltransferase
VTTQAFPLESAGPRFAIAEAARLGTARIRHGRDDDADGLMTLIGTVWAEYPDKAFDWDGERPAYEAIATRYAERDGRLWIAEDGGRIIGSIALAPAETPGGVELQKMYVAKPYRCGGLGTRLCELLELEARLRSAHFIDLWSDVKLRAAHSLYETLGYRRTGATRTYADVNRTVRYYYLKTLEPAA